MWSIDLRFRPKVPSFSIDMKTLFLVLVGFGLLSSCAHFSRSNRGEEGAQDPALTEYQQAHQRFEEQPNYKTLIYKNEELLPQLTPENARIEIFLSTLRGRVLLGDEVVVDTPVSPGRKSHPTPTGEYSILGKIKGHRSNLYGTIYGPDGEWVASGDQRKHEIPEGGKFVGVKMPYWMRLTNTGIGLHVGTVPNYPASHGCIRLPAKIGPLIYEKTRVGTPVLIKP